MKKKQQQHQTVAVTQNKPQDTTQNLQAKQGFYEDNYNFPKHLKDSLTLALK